MDCFFLHFGLLNAAESFRCVSVSEPLWRVLLSPSLILLSAFVAFLGIKNVRAVARQKATLDIIEKFESTPHYRDLNEAFSAVRKATGFSVLHDPKTDADRTARGNVQDYLNHYELIAIGIKNNILDDRIYKNWMASAVVRDWNAASAYIQSERWRLNEAKDDFVYHQKLYENYQWLACRFSKASVKLTVKSSPKPDLAHASGPGVDPLPEPTIEPESDQTHQPDDSTDVDLAIEEVLIAPPRWKAFTPLWLQRTLERRKP